MMRPIPLLAADFSALLRANASSLTPSQTTPSGTTARSLEGKNADNQRNRAGLSVIELAIDVPAGARAHRLMAPKSAATSRANIKHAMGSESHRVLCMARLTLN